jgi:hypothetical protein
MAGGQLAATEFTAKSPQGTLIRWIAFRPRSDGFGKQSGSDVLGTDVARYQGPVVTLPWVSQAAYEVAAHRLTWGESAGGSYDAAVGQFGWSNGDDFFTWIATVRAADGKASVNRSFIAPSLPADVGVVFSTDPTVYFSSVELVQNLELPDDYRAARNTPEWTLRPTSGAQRRMMSSDSP